MREDDVQSVPLRRTMQLRKKIITRSSIVNKSTKPVYTKLPTTRAKCLKKRKSENNYQVRSDQRRPLALWEHLSVFLISQAAGCLCLGDSGRSLRNNRLFAYVLTYIHFIKH